MVATPPAAVATLFKVRGGAIGTVRRFDPVHAALRAASRETVPPGCPLP